MFVNNKSCIFTCKISSVNCCISLKNRFGIGQENAGKGLGEEAMGKQVKGYKGQGKPRLAR